MSPSICIPSVLVARVSNKTISVPISLHELQKINKTVDLEALLDSGAGGLFIDETFVKQNNFTLHELPEPLNAYNGGLYCPPLIPTGIRWNPVIPEDSGGYQFWL